jgi:WD40 repeat protein
MRLWDAPPERCFLRPLPQGRNVDGLALSPDGRLLAAGRDDGTLKLWDADTGSLVAEMASGKGSLNLAEFSPDGKWLLIGQNDSDGPLVRLWDVAAKKFIRERRFALRDLPDRAVYGCAFSPDGRKILLSPRGYPLQIWEPEADRWTEGRQAMHEPVFFHLEYSGDGKQILAVDMGGVHLWDAATMEVQPASRKPGVVACFHPNSRRTELFTLQQGQGEFWDPTEENAGRPARFQTAAGFERARFSRAANGLVLTNATDRKVRLWHVATGHPVGSALLTDGTGRLVFSADGRRVAAAGQRGRIVLWDVPRPLSGEVKRLRTWVELLTRQELTEAKVVRPLSDDDLQERGALLEKLGGPPVLGPK